MTRFLNWLLRRKHEHDWEVLSFFAIDDDFQYVVMETCSVPGCEAVMVRTP